ncbi:leucine-rich repeat extensin-like protein 5 [Grammomys surdaster]|uniref:leucine-rich repeat extensin-like protein 5 n=1 Tax=Grammomys surdaster TaxID=491861 RepID=UPI00109F311C|nr:leucine-rich repeat extensin-like protein 5 [Grammomys surdaster]
MADTDQSGSESLRPQLPLQLLYSPGLQPPPPILSLPCLPLLITVTRTTLTIRTPPSTSAPQPSSILPLLSPPTLSTTASISATHHISSAIPNNTITPTTDISWLPLSMSPPPPPSRPHFLSYYHQVAHSILYFSISKHVNIFS